MEKMSAAGNSDAELVAGSLADQRDGFRQIVERYQSLICSLAYSATGSLSQSEDLAQETFVAAWKQLAELREPSKLRSWLCGIARNRIGKALRRDGREPVHGAEPLGIECESPAPEPLPPEHAIGREEEAILWRSLERIPETYREPLVLFYREHRSLELVAEELELSEDAVKQRLSRGRKLLHEEVLAFVEGTLERTNPGRAFTLGVLAALPLFTISAEAATIGATAAKGSAVAKSAGFLGLFNAVLGPVFGLLCTYLGYRIDLDGARSPQRREFLRKFYRVLVTGIAVFMLASLSLVLGGRSLARSQPLLVIALLAGLGVVYIIFVLILTFWMRRCRRKIREQELAESRSVPLAQPVFEYRSKATLLGLPLVHIRIRAGMERGPVKAWIAAGDAAIGVIFAFGGYAIAPVSIGGLAIGLLPLGGFAVGPVALGGFSLAIWSLGGFALGWQACGGCAIAWNAAFGGTVWARDFALGGIAQAAQANNDAARFYIQASPFFQAAQIVERHSAWMILFGLIPLGVWLLWLRARRRPVQSSGLAAND